MGWRLLFDCKLNFDQMIQNDLFRSNFQSHVTKSRQEELRAWEKKTDENFRGELCKKRTLDIIKLYNAK